jgi:bifunctional DNase/RNase
MKQMDLAGLATEVASGGSVVVLREQDEPHRLLPIFVGDAEAAAIAIAVSGQAPPRPLTHDLMAALVETFEGHVDAVEVTDLDAGTFVATLAVHGAGGARRVDTRPSDAIALAVRLDVPVFVSEAVLDEAGTLPAEEDAEILDEEAIDEVIDEFRSFLDGVDPTHFVGDAVDDPDGSEDPDGAAETGDTVDEHDGSDGDAGGDHG